ncbi:MAG TPA: hypothetical protein VJL88_15410 [Nitrospira sp.]|nr:hypothetical protein [Nitrospira sp.]
MQSLQPVRRELFIVLLLAAGVWPDHMSLAASTVYYCPDRQADQQYSAQAGPGCLPLVEKKKDSPEGTPQRQYQVDNLERDVAVFLDRYQKFLECCKTDLNELREVEKMGDELDQLLAVAQAQLSNYSLASRGIMLRELIPRVAKARADLKILHARLEGINEASGQPQKIRELEEAIERDIHAPQLPGSAKTGTTIGAAPAAGPAIGRSPKTGTDIGQEGLTGSNIGATPKSSRDIGSSGLSGFEIGATGRAGPAIGESTLNRETSSGVGSTLQPSTIGSSISDSTVGSSINPSNVGSSLQDMSIGSSSAGPGLPSR